MSSYFEKPQYITFTLWDIDREFQGAYESYEQWLARNRRRKSRWECFTRRNQDDELGKSLSLGRRLQTLMETAMDKYGTRFDRGDATCHDILTAQLIRVQQEIHLPLLDCAIGRTTLPIPYTDLLTTAKSVRRTCLNALRDQCTRLQSSTTTTSDPTTFLLPPPRFSVSYCAFANQLRRDRKAPFYTKKLRPHDRHDEREICPACEAHVAITPHSGLVAYRHLLFQSHLARPPSSQTDAASASKKDAVFACESCYKTFEDSYGFLEHTFQRDLGSERSCQRWWVGVEVRRVWVDAEPGAVEKSLRNCLRRELGRIKAMKVEGG
ncbi:hypothetical protein EJ04DRAFT_515525 [Polyplosphaeria fusca]|uniref:Uncharacterized protein n=1 Tax=Polyplosphaeria fusca TaxID=682080 RepID=A0A9P4QME1_9PLEO|nr:hypothetical protein EJ04DRAFT_515525 [Polyplosphaeria fusca]